MEPFSLVSLIKSGYSNNEDYVKITSIKAPLKVTV